jgi:hypothetical protein
MRGHWIGTARAVMVGMIGIAGLSAADPVRAQAQGGGTPPATAPLPSPQPPAQPAETRTKDRAAPARRPETAPPPETHDGEAAMAAECAWIGKRIVSLLVRDDAMAAGDFVPFYLRFHCPDDRIGKAFGCIVRTGEATPNEVLAERIDQCWTNPDVRFPKLQRDTPAEPAPAAPPPAKPAGPGGN